MKFSLTFEFEVNSSERVAKIVMDEMETVIRKYTTNPYHEFFRIYPETSILQQRFEDRTELIEKHVSH